jgi:signal peptide peptidase SppA
MNKTNLLSTANGNAFIQVPTRLLNTPLMVSQSEADLILTALSGALPAGMFLGLFDEEPQRTYEVKNGVAVLPVMGGLIYRGYGWYWRGTYGQIRKQFREALADPEVTAILFDVDSPGGEVAGVFDLVDEIHAARGQKPICAVANEDCFSAAYAIASAADKVYLPRTGAVGSVGVIAIHYEQSKAEADIGIQYTAIFAGAHKNDFSMHAPLSTEARAVAQASVDKTYDLFVATVARNRNMSAEAVRAQQAAIYDGDEAVSAGLADGVKTFDAILSELGAGPGRITTSSPQAGAQTDTGGKVMEFEQIWSGLAALLTDTEQKAAALEKLRKMGFVQEDPASAQTALADAEKKGAAAEKLRAKAIAEKCILAGVPQMAPQLIGEEIDAEAAGTRILEARHNADQSQGLDNSNSGLGASGADFVMADAKRRADAAKSK